MLQNPQKKEKIKVLGIAGSLRKGSYNRALLRAAQEVAPHDMEIKIFDNQTLKRIPTYNEDVRTLGEPETVEIMKREIDHVDALLFAIPEYNYSMSGVLKNAIDWVSRPPNESPLDGKPIAIMGASVGLSGTTRAQMHFRQLCVFTNMLPLNKPQVMVPRAADKFSSDGILKDEDTRDHVRLLTKALLEWIRKLYYGSIMVGIGSEAILENENI